MPSITYTPGDQVVTLTASTVGTFTNVASGGFNAVAKEDVVLSITGDTYASVDGGASDSGSCNSYIEYTTNGGGAWTPIAAFTSSVVVPGPGGFLDASQGPKTETVNLGTVADLSQVDIRGRVVITLTGVATANGTVDTTAWSLRSRARGGMTME